MSNRTGPDVTDGESGIGHDLLEEGGVVLVVGSSGWDASAEAQAAVLLAPLLVRSVEVLAETPRGRRELARVDALREILGED